MRSYNVRFGIRLVALKARQNLSFAANESIANVNSVNNGDGLDVKTPMFVSLVKSLLVRVSSGDSVF